MVKWAGRRFSGGYSRDKAALPHACFFDNISLSINSYCRVSEIINSYTKEPFAPKLLRARHDGDREEFKMSHTGWE